MRKVTLRDIAQKSGVSVTSVSLAMRGSKRVSPEKTKEIRNLANEMGYVRDPMMSALCSYRDSTRPRNKNANINFLQFGADSPAMKDAGKVASDFWRGALDQSQQLGYSLNTIWAGDPSLSPSRLKNILNSRGVSGLIVYEANCPISKFESIFEDFSSIWVGDGPKGASLHSVRLNRFSSMNLVWSHLSELGYQNGGLIMADHSLDQNYGEWEAAHNHFQRKFVGQPHFIPPLTFTSKDSCNKEELKQWVERWNPQVVISTFRVIYPMLLELGYSIPKDLGYLSLSTKMGSEISGIDQQTESIAQTGVRLLDQLICNREVGIPHHQQIIETNGDWVEGRSLTTQM